jgi:dTDP-4-dehydrorhamnose reductase
LWRLYVDVGESPKQGIKAGFSEHQAVAVIAEYAKKAWCKAYTFSTDYVFDGNSAFAFNEAAPTHPINTYGAQ